MFIDLLFFFFSGFVFTIYFQKIFDKLFMLSDVIKQDPYLLLEPTQENVANLINIQNTFMQHYNDIVKLLISVTLILFFSYIVLQGINWKIAVKLIKKKLSMPIFLFKFFIINLFWLVILAIIIYLFVNLSVINIYSLNNLLNKNFINVFFILLLIPLFYFIFISYSLLVDYKIKTLIKKTFVIGFIKRKTLLRAYSFLLFSFVILILLLKLILTINILFIILSLILLLPLISFGRILFVYNLIGQSVKHNHKTAKS
jgi:hypothetical protein